MSNQDTIVIVFISIIIFICIIIVLSSICLIYIGVKGKKEIDRAGVIFNNLLNQEEILANQVIDDLRITKDIITTLDEAFDTFQPQLQSFTSIAQIWAREIQRLLTE
tara:strand:+ start:321 stop:641 length:321 start_codon:yes stop_codon:yes gene_type:complete